MGIFSFLRKNRDQDDMPLHLSPEENEQFAPESDERRARFETEFLVVATSPNGRTQLRLGRMMRDLVLCRADAPRELLLHGDACDEDITAGFLSDSRFFVVSHHRAMFFDIAAAQEPFSLLEYPFGDPASEPAQHQLLAMDWDGFSRRFAALYILGTGLEDISPDPHYRLALFDAQGKLLEDHSTGLLFERLRGRIVAPRVRLQNEVVFITSERLFSNYEFSLTARKLSEFAKHD